MRVNYSIYTTYLSKRSKKMRIWGEGIPPRIRMVDAALLFADPPSRKRGVGTRFHCALRRHYFLHRRIAEPVCLEGSSQVRSSIVYHTAMQRTPLILLASCLFA